MVEILNVAMWMIHGEMLIKEDGVKHGDIFNTHQYTIVGIWLWFGRGRLMASEPLEKGLVIFRAWTLEVHVVHLVRCRLIRKWRLKQNGHLVCPADFDVRKLEDHFGLKWCDCSEERMGCLVPCNILTV